MLYAIVGIAAFIIVLIINSNVLFRKKHADDIPAAKPYRLFLSSVLVYYLVDILWGFFYEDHLAVALAVDTYIYFVVMAASVLAWTRFVVVFLNEKKSFGIILSVAGWVFFAFEIAALIANFFKPVMFEVGETAEYNPFTIRYVALTLQVALFLVTSIYALISAARRPSFKRRYIAIGVSGLSMMSVIILQIADPLLPLYNIGLTIAICILHTFVVADISAEKRREVEVANEAMKNAQQRANTDALTGVKSKHAYHEREGEINKAIALGTQGAFGVIVCDVNGLKNINDRYGHIHGDFLLKKACDYICTYFKYSPVFRIGGDEFVVLLEGQDYENRVALLAEFDLRNENNVGKTNVVIATGMSEYRPDEDDSYRAVFIRADNKMYKRKEQLKNMNR